MLLEREVDKKRVEEKEKKEQKQEKGPGVQPKPVKTEIKFKAEEPVKEAPPPVAAKSEKE